MLESEPDFAVVSAVSSGPEAVDSCAQLGPDLVLMDLRMPCGEGVEATWRIRQAQPDVRVVVLTTYETDQDILRAVEAGAAGYLLKDSSKENLAEALRAASRGETVLAPSVATALVSRLRGDSTPRPQLSGRELEVLRLAAAGSTNAEMGRAMFISETTVKTHLLRAYAKLGVSDRTAAVAQAIRHGLLPAV